jgi:thiamine biosynthesis lipoprotein
VTSPASSDAYVHIFHHEEHVMGTIVTLDLYNDTQPSASTLAPVIELAIRELHDADHLFSTWNDASELSKIRRGELRVDDAAPEVKLVLELCKEARTISKGWFDPWAMPGGVDPTGLVKGWAAQRSLNALRRANVAGALVNAAGDIASFGGPEPGQPFRIGIVHPADPKQLACVVTTPGAVGTSGTYERGAHLVDPFSGAATTRAASATVVGADLALADALATALVIAGEEGLEMVRELTNYEGLIINDDGRFHMTPDFPLIERLTPAPS